MSRIWRRVQGLRVRWRRVECPSPSGVGYLVGEGLCGVCEGAFRVLSSVVKALLGEALMCPSLAPCQTYR